MRRAILLTLVTLGSVVPGVPAHAADEVNKDYRIVFEAALPCAVACAYWQEAIGFSSCEEPFPPGSYDDIVITAPGAADALEFVIFPNIDWDSYICQYTASGTGGDELGTGAHPVDEPCDTILGQTPVGAAGCVETAFIAVTGGAKYRLRAYNWSDLPNTVGRYRWFDLK